MKSLNRFKSLILICVFVLVLPFNVFASDVELFGPGEWDVIYEGSMMIYPSSNGINTSTVTSGGGDIRLCIQGIDAGNNASFQFFTSTGNFVGPLLFYINNGNSASQYYCFPKIDVRPFVNSNGKVFLYVRATSPNSDYIYLTIED